LIFHGKTSVPFPQVIHTQLHESWVMSLGDSAPFNRCFRETVFCKLLMACLKPEKIGENNLLS